MAKTDSYKLTDLSEGILQGVANSIVPRNSVYLSCNLTFHENIGYAKVRKGSEKLGDDQATACQNLFHFIKTNGDKKLLGVFGDSIYSLETDTWTSRTAMTASSNTRFLTFADTVLAIDGTLAKSSTNGTTWVTTGGNLNVDDMPAGKYVLNWKDRVYVAGVSGYPDRLYFSSIYGVPDAGKVSWTDDTAGNIEIDPEDGAGGIVGLAKVPGYLLILKERSLHRWNGQSTFPESLINIGTQSQESMTLCRESLFFWNERGVYETNGGYPRKVSRKVQDIVDAVSSTYDVSAWSDSETVYFSIGDIEIADMDLENCILCYHIETQTWTLFSYKSDMVVLASYLDSKIYLIAGDSDGQVWKLNVGTSDDSKDIEYHLQFQTIELGERGRLKSAEQFIIYTEDIRNAVLNARSEKKNFKPLGTIKDDVEVINESVSGRYIDLRISGMGRSDAEIKGLEISELNIDLGTEQ
jgi:hypothetical protein